MGSGGAVVVEQEPGGGGGVVLGPWHCLPPAWPRLGQWLYRQAHSPPSHGHPELVSPSSALKNTGHG